MQKLSTRDIGNTRMKAYHSRRQRAYTRVEALGLRRRWIAQQVGRSVRCVTEVLAGTDTGEPTLVLIEILLMEIQHGTVVLTPNAIRSRR